MSFKVEQDEPQGQSVNTEPVEREIRSLEDRRYQAMIEADTDTLEQLLGDGLVYTHSIGVSDGKAAYLEGVKAKKFTYRKIERPQEQIQLYGDTAVVTGRAHGDLLVDGAPRVANLRYISVWVKGPRGWQTVAFQATSIPT